MAEVPYGVLLSGGLDSSLIAAIATRMRRRPVHDKAGSPVVSDDDDDDIKCKMWYISIYVCVCGYCLVLIFHSFY